MPCAPPPRATLWKWPRHQPWPLSQPPHRQPARKAIALPVLTTAVAAHAAATSPATALVATAVMVKAVATVAHVAMPKLPRKRLRRLHAHVIRLSKSWQVSTLRCLANSHCRSSAASSKT